MGDPSSKFPSRSASRLGDHAEEGWDLTLRPTALDTAISRAATHSRESSFEKLLPLHQSQSQPQPHSASSSIASPRLHASQRAGLALGGVLERFIDPKNSSSSSSSSSYGHHRQTSIVHGIQHSRNGSVASSSSSPLSPEIIAAAGSGFVTDMSLPRVDSEVRSLISLSGTTITSSHLDRSALPPLPETGTGYGLAPRKMERMQSRSRRDQSRNHSHSSRHHREDKDTVVDYTLQVLFASFLSQAEEKLAHFGALPTEVEPFVEPAFGPGADPAFDQSIIALGHISRKQPKPVIDMVMGWRKRKSDAASLAREEYQRAAPKQSLSNGLLQRRNTEPVNQGLGPSPSDSQISLQASAAAKHEYATQAERVSGAATYVLCRVLLRVLRQSTLAAIGKELEKKLEDIIIHQIQILELNPLPAGPIKLATRLLYIQLLGAMSEINFQALSQRMISDIEKYLVDAPTKTLGMTMTRDLEQLEQKVEAALAGVKYVRIQTAPDAAWALSCDFILAIARLYSNVHGQKIKELFCTNLELLLLPVAANAGNAELVASKWAEVLSTINSKLVSGFGKPRNWLSTFPLTSTIICASPPDVVANQWMQLITPLQAKLKDPKTQPTCLQAISRLLWAYLYRTNETDSNSVRKMEEIWKLLMPVLKRPLIASDAAIAEPLIQIIRFIGFKIPDYCIKSFIFVHLINLEALKAPAETIKCETLEPDRMVIGIRAFLAILGDLERGDDGRPPFPQVYTAHVMAQPAQDRLLGSPAGSVVSVVPAPPPPPPSQAAKEEETSRPVQVSTLSETVRDHFSRFCEVLGKVTRVCDGSYGGKAALEEKLNPPTLAPSLNPGAKTPITDTFNFARRDEPVQSQKQTFYDLLHVAIQALPRCLPTDMSLHTLINLLCTGTAHLQPAIAQASTQSLKAIARQSHAQHVAMGFARFIFEFDESYSTMSDGGMLGPGHIESTLKLYVDLLQIWQEEIKQKAKEAEAENDDADSSAARRGLKLDLSGIWAEVDQAEARGLFFLCSQSRRVRRFAIAVLRLIAQFDQALGKKESQDAPRLIHVLENDAKQVMEFKEEHLTVAERSRLQRGMQSANSRAALVELCTSDVSYDTTLWYKIFPKFVALAHDKCPFTVTICRDLVCTRITQLYKAIMTIADPTKNPRYGPEATSARLNIRTPTTQPEVLVDQWKLYLIFACTTLADMGPPTASAPPALQQHQSQGQSGQQSQPHSRKGSRPSNSDKMEPKKMDLRTLIKLLTPLFLVPSTSVRDSTVSALGSININLYQTLLDELAKPILQINNDNKSRAHQRSSSAPQRNPIFDQMRTEVAHVYKLTAHFLQEKQVYENDDILKNLMTFTTDLKLFLMDGDVQMEWEFQKLRGHYCGIMEQFFEGINRGPNPAKWMNFEARKSAFSLMEEWCGFALNQSQIKAREDTMRQSLMEQQSNTERVTLTAAMEIERRNLRTAALSAMAALCAGPLSVMMPNGLRQSFDIRRLLLWIDTIFNSGSDRVNLIGRRALLNLIVHNRDHPFLMEHCLARCYVSEVPKVLESYFMVATEIALDYPDYQFPFWKQLGLCLYTLGNDSSELRTRAAHVLRTLEDRQQRNSSKIQDFDISIADKTQAVYKLAQFEISKRFARVQAELAFHLFSQFTFYFKEISSSNQRNIVAVVLPWIQSIELQMDPNGGPTAQSYVLLANLLEITIKASGSLHNEVQALWQALATGPHPGNVRLILDFIMALCLDRREQNFVEYAKQVVVFLSSTSSVPGAKVVEFLLLQITPKAMAPNEKRDVLPPPPDINQLPYCADLAVALPVGTKQAGFSTGQLAMILLVDLMVSPVQLAPDHLPVLLQVVMVLWDHYTPLIQEQAREMLVHLIHELVISRLDDGAHAESKRSIEGLIDLIRRHDREVVWDYENGNAKTDDGGDNRVPASMAHLAKVVVQTFEITFPGIKDQWSHLSLTWATSCPVRHLACRSFQIFRCILTSLDHKMLGSMLTRLCNTIADEDAEIQKFAMEILATLRTLIVELRTEQILQLPQLFWAICACLDSINESEFLEAVGMLDVFLDKVDLQSPGVRQLLSDGQPARWDGPFEGVQPLVYKGLRSSLCWKATLAVVEKLARLPSHPLVGDDNRVFFALVANFPRLLEELDHAELTPEVLETAETLIRVCQAHALTSIAIVLDDFISAKYETGAAFLARYLAALREHFLPHLDFQLLTFCMGLLTNSLPWVKRQTLVILKAVIAEVDMKSPEISSHGSDFISPLLRLLPTEFFMEAIDVLDTITMLPANSAENNHYIRMSMTRSTNYAMRKEYERMQSLFGIPEESGWAIPMPAKKTDSTRANIHAAFYMCLAGEGGGAVSVPSATPEVEVHDEDFAYGYFPPAAAAAAAAAERAESLLSDGGARSPGGHHVARGEDLATKLDSLDDFFDDPADGQFDDDGHSSRTVTEYSPEDFESTELYDEHMMLPTLGQPSSLPGPVPLRSGFAERTPPPTAFGNGGGGGTMQGLAAGGFHSPRPGLQWRSMTTPAAPVGDVLSDDDYHEDLFSDEDERPNTGGGSEGSLQVEGHHTIRAFNVGGGSGSSRSGPARRLAAARLREGDRMGREVRPPPSSHHHHRGQASGQTVVPSVPAVPDIYARNVAAGQGNMV